MVTIRSVNEIILGLIDFFRLSQPDLDIKPGTVARDLFIEAPAGQLSLLYEELSNISNLQSFRLVVGSDLDKLAKNFGVVRKQATPATGVALLTFASINAPININKGDIIIANNGFAYSTTSGVAITTASTNFYKSVATKFRDQLDTVGISDQYAVEVTVAATSAGSSGNIGKYALNRTSIPGVSNVTNINAFAGGLDQEDDTTFRNRILATFSGSSVGTALGYLNAATSTEGVIDAVVIQPGDPLMTRDGTEVRVNSDGSRDIISEGAGGKVDIAVMGTNLQENTESYIYQDKSNTNDPTNSKNNVVLGQISGDQNKTISRKRIDNIKNGVLPIQPVDTLTQITGSVSGTNFIEKVTDSYGRVSGNYELLKDTGVYGGSAWGFDALHWISNKISDFSEDRVKGQFNGQDNLTFTDVLGISKVQQFISITNENSTVTYDRSIIQLLHYPATNVTRVFNVNTGERYVIVSQNYDNTGTYNTTGRIKISGNTLPSFNDILQVDYSWVFEFDKYSDYDGLLYTSNPRSVTDSIDWGYASVIKDERITFSKDTASGYFIGTAQHPVSSVINAKTFLEVDGIVAKLTTGIYANRFSVTIQNMMISPSTIDSIVLKNTNSELYSTSQANGTFIITTDVFGINIVYNVTIILPTDTVAQTGDKVTVCTNSTDVFYATTTNGSFSGSQITIPSSLIDTSATEIVLKVNYIANISDLFSAATTSLPTSRIGNGFSLLNNNGFNNFSVVNISRREHATVQKNLSSQYYVELSLPSSEFSLSASQIITVIRLSDGADLWNSDYPGTINIGTSGNYQLILSGLGTPATKDRCLVVYYATDSRRYQPFSYNNSIIKSRKDQLTLDPISGQMIVKLNKFVSQASGMTFTIFEPNTNLVILTVTDGYLSALSSTAKIGSATAGTLPTCLASNPDLTLKKVQISGATDPNNNGIYDIISYNLTEDTLTIKNVLDNVAAEQICVVRVLDGKEVWNYSGTIQVSNNRILLPTNSNLSTGDYVFVIYFRYFNLRQASTKIINTTIDQSVNTGTLVISGITLSKAQDIVFTATRTGLTQNLLEAARKALNLSSTTSVPSTIKLVKLIKLEKVETVSNNSDEVLDVLTTYDVDLTTIKNNLLYSNDMLGLTSLQNLEFVLPSTQNNLLNLETKNLPILGDKLRVTFYYTTDDDSESLVYTRNGALYTNKKFAFINKIYISSGFRSSQSTRLTTSSFTQPTLGARYKVFYDYTAPKQNERITIKYNYNKLITDVTFNVEASRPVNADVLVRSSKRILLDLTVNVVISSDYTSSSATVLQNLRNELTKLLTASQLGTTVDSVNIINTAQSVAGIARARILYFNKTGNSGQVLSVAAQEDEYLAPNTITINTETR